MQDPNTANQGDLIFKLDQDRAWLLKILIRVNGQKSEANLPHLKEK